MILQHSTKEAGCGGETMSRYSRNVPLITLLASLLLFLSGGCFTWFEKPDVTNLPPEDFPKIPAILAQSTEQILPGWIQGVIVQEVYTESHGINDDKFNVVRFRVYIPNGLAWLRPCSAYQEHWFIETYDPGDIVAFQLPSTFNTIGSTTSTFKICREEIIMIRENALSLPLPLP
ncbi:MAG: hypothetical protein A3E07_01555 [Candidatus Wildermuthbacteria bacterium RIFCSPHIGHO2_12_FULL_45_9]|nr:MAG: hypothetical protein A3E07_01555 [Candidatus Wildermuthbacteria bacterium RIFCSPHIGHO2_12_FULL_45_9]